MTFSVFPDFKTSDVNIQPYNSVLTLKRLTEKADAVVVLDNQALYQIAESKLNVKRNSADSNNAVNKLVSIVMAATTTTLRFPSYSNNDMVSLLAPLVPIPQCHFLMTGYTPLLVGASQQIVRRTSVIDVMNRLLDPKNLMVSTHIDRGMFISILNIIQGDIDPSEIQNALGQIRENRALRFIPWGPASVQLALTRKSPHVEMPNRVSGLMLANHTNIRTLMQGILNQVNVMFKTKASLLHYKKSDVMGGEKAEQYIAESIEAVKGVINEYADAEREEFGGFE
jgi:tubulin gamma